MAQSKCRGFSHEKWWIFPWQNVSSPEGSSHLNPRIQVYHRDLGCEISRQVMLRTGMTNPPYIMQHLDSVTWWNPRKTRRATCQLNWINHLSPALNKFGFVFIIYNGYPIQYTILHMYTHINVNIGQPFLQPFASSNMVIAVKPPSNMVDLPSHVWLLEDIPTTEMIPNVGGFLKWLKTSPNHPRFDHLNMEYFILLCTNICTKMWYWNIPGSGVSHIPIIIITVIITVIIVIVIISQTFSVYGSSHLWGHYLATTWEMRRSQGAEFYNWSDFWRVGYPLVN